MRAAMLGRARQYFADHEVLAVDTPALASSAPTDPNIASMSIRATDLYSHTSP